MYHNTSNMSETKRYEIHWAKAALKEAAMKSSPGAMPLLWEDCRLDYPHWVNVRLAMDAIDLCPRDTGGLIHAAHTALARLVDKDVQRAAWILYQICNRP